MIALSSWEEKRWNENRLGLGGEYRACVGRAQGALLVCAAPGKPWSLLTLCIILWKACREWQVPPAQVVALLEVGQLPGDAFLGRKCTFGKTRDGSGAQIHHTWLEAPKGSTKGNRVWQNRWFSPKPSLTNTRATLELPKCPVSGSLIFPVLLWSAENRSSGNCLREREGVFHFRGPTSQFIPPLLSLLSASSVQVGRGLM